MIPYVLALLLLVGFVAGCAGTRGKDATIKTLTPAEVALEKEVPVEAGRRKAIENYEAFLKRAPNNPLRVEAMRRLGDIEMDINEDRLAAKPDPDAIDPQVKDAPPPSSAKVDYRHAIKLYQDLLKAYPNYSGNDRVLYQLSRAYENSGDLDRALSTLDRLISEYRATSYLDEAQFRRGEILFVKKSYADAEQAYAAVLRQGDRSLFYDKALYKHGWTRFKQSRYEEGLDSFFLVMDRTLGNREPGTLVSDIPNLSRAERELIEDTFRVVSLSLSYLQGPKSAEQLFAKHGARPYEFRVYQELGDLYIKQERIQDAAGTYNAFVRRYPNHPQSPFFQVKVIDAFKQGNFPSQVLEAKKEFAIRYGVDSEFRKVNSEAAYAQILPNLKSNLEDLARHYHGSAQKSKAAADYQEAALWYRTFLRSFPKDPQAPNMNFLLAEMLYESKQYPDAIVEYEKVAYGYENHPKSADAGYTALLAYAAHEKSLPEEEKKLWEQKYIASSVRYADTFPQDARTPAVLAQSAERLYAAHSPDRAAELARRVLAIKPEVDPKLRRTAWTVVAHTEFERGGFDRAEKAYQQALALLPDKDPARAPMTERLAASIYKQGEQARAVGDFRAAVGHFMRVGQLAPSSPVRVTAEYDAAASLIALKDWAGAAKILEHFRSSYPGHELQAEVSSKLAVAYLESGQLPRAAAEFEALANSKQDPKLRREAIWQAAELYEKANSAPQAAAAYERYVKEFPRPLEPAMEARQRLVEIYKASGRTKEHQHWLAELVRADQAGGNERSDRTRYLAASAALGLAEPYYEEYRRVRLVEPLKKSLQQKKDKMQAALKVYGSVADYGVAEVTTASTFRIAEIYHDFSRELLASQRPKGLSGAELEQYNVLLEEQAFPFEEKAIEIHEVNAQRAAKGIYDQWVKNSFTALGKLRPVRYAKAEKSPGVIDAIR